MTFSEKEYYVTLETPPALKQEILKLFRNSHQRCSIKKDVLKNFAKFTGKHLCQSLFFNKVVGFLVQVFSCDFCEMLKNAFFTEQLRVAASDCSLRPLYTIAYLGPKMWDLDPQMIKDSENINIFLSNTLKSRDKSIFTTDWIFFDMSHWKFLILVMRKKYSK